MDKFKGKRPLKLYDVYKGKKYVMTGNILEIAKALDMSVSGVANYINSDVNPSSRQKYLLLPIEGSNEVIYAMYRGEKLLEIGTKHELAKKFNIKTTTVEHYSYAAHHKRVKGTNRMFAIRLDTKDIEEIHKMNWAGG